jgi:hypothetical protein
MAGAPSGQLYHYVKPVVVEPPVKPGAEEHKYEKPLPKEVPSKVGCEQHKWEKPQEKEIAGKVGCEQYVYRPKPVPVIAGKVGVEEGGPQLQKKPSEPPHTAEKVGADWGSCPSPPVCWVSACCCPAAPM